MYSQCQIGQIATVFEMLDHPARFAPHARLGEAGIFRMAVFCGRIAFARCFAICKIGQREAESAGMFFQLGTGRVLCAFMIAVNRLGDIFLKPGQFGKAHCVKIDAGHGFSLFGENPKLRCDMMQSC